jgi:hypothetical protein
MELVLLAGQLAAGRSVAAHNVSELTSFFPSAYSRKWLRMDLQKRAIVKTWLYV